MTENTKAQQVSEGGVLPLQPKESVRAPKKDAGGAFHKQTVMNFFLYVSPWIIGFLCFTLVPMVMSLIYSFTKVTMTTATKGNFAFNFDNYIRVFTNDQKFIGSIGNTFFMAFFKVLLLTVCSLLIAVLLNRELPGQKIYRIAIYLPAVIPSVSVALLWRLMFSGEMNVVNYILGTIGIPPVSFFGDGFIAKMMIVFIGVWGGLGSNMFIFLAALQGVPQDIIEAAELDGAGAVRRFISIVVPTIAPTVFFVALTGAIGSLQMYTEVELLTKGGPGGQTATMNLLIVQNAFEPFGKKTLGYACAQAWVVFIIVFTLTLIVNKLKAKFGME